MPKCFIIMPITTPKRLVEDYANDEDHFTHVLDCLFIPAIREAGFDPIPPIAEGADIIHGRIISNLEQADMVLCDMSTLNPNVFFELGIRTALNKPVAMIKDETTSHVPFDTGIINYYEYASSLNAWDVTSEIAALAQHISKSVENSENANTLWRYFGLSTPGQPHSETENVEDRVAYLARQIQAMRNELAESKRPWEPEYSADSLADLLVTTQALSSKNPRYETFRDILLAGKELRRSQRNRIVKVLESVAWDMNRAAEELNVPLVVVANAVEELGIQPGPEAKDAEH